GRNREPPVRARLPAPRSDQTLQERARARLLRAEVRVDPRAGRALPRLPLSAARAARYREPAMDADAQVKGVLARGKAGERVRARGWLRTARHSKGVSFLDLTDGSCLAGLQVVCGPELANFESEVRKLDTGCAVEIEGELVASQGKGQALELRAARLDVVG